MADACGLDIDEIVQEKIKVNNEKYPVSKAKGKKEKYNKLWNMFMKHLSEMVGAFSLEKLFFDVASVVTIWEWLVDTLSS